MGLCFKGISYFNQDEVCFKEMKLMLNDAKQLKVRGLTVYITYIIEKVVLYIDDTVNPTESLSVEEIEKILIDNKIPYKLETIKQSVQDNVYKNTTIEDLLSRGTDISKLYDRLCLEGYSNLAVLSLIERETQLRFDALLWNTTVYKRDAGYRLEKCDVNEIYKHCKIEIIKANFDILRVLRETK